MSKHNDFDALRSARRVIDLENQGLNLLSKSLNQDFSNTIDKISGLQGRLILTGVGKSGHVARKIAATLSSTGTPAFYVHPSEASHGDMGMITKQDAVLALSKSGETKELADIIAYARRFSIPLIAMTVKRESTLGRVADCLLLLPDAPEACTETSAPTSSTTLQMAYGDALAVTLLEKRGFTADDFHIFHPGGALGARLRTAQDIMHEGDLMPLVRKNIMMDEALIVMTEKGFGCLGVTDEEGKLCGAVTDGDLRRHMSADMLHKKVCDIMTPSPKTTGLSTLASDVLRLMTAGESKIMQVFVVDQKKRPLGIIHMHDCLRAGLA